MLHKLVFMLTGMMFFQGTMPAQIGKASESTDYTLGFSTYLSHTDKYAAGFDVFSDGDGFVYVSGCTRDRNFPATAGAFQKELKGDADAFVAKLSPDGKIVFATLIGGSQREHHTAITVDKDGYIYLTGGTHSSDFPVTAGAYDTRFNGEGEWAGDIYVVKMNPSGTDIVFATFIGGKVEDTISSGNIKIDSKGNIIIAGVTCSADFPATQGVIDNQFSKQDSFLSKFSPNGDRLLFSTSLVNGVQDMITDLDIDSQDNIYVTGYTCAPDLPASANAIRKKLILAKTGGYENGIDHFVAKINETGTKILYLSYLGSGGHMGASLSWLDPNRLVVCGSTNEDGFPVSDKALRKIRRGERDCFVTAFNSVDMSLEYSTLLGGSESDSIASVSFIDPNTIAIGGTTVSANFPLTPNALYSEFPSVEKTFNNSFFGRRKAFVSIIDIQSGKLLYSSYLGGCFRFQIHAGKSGNIAFIAETGQREAAGTTGFPITEKALAEPPTDIMVGRLDIKKMNAASTMGAANCKMVPGVLAPGHKNGGFHEN